MPSTTDGDEVMGPPVLPTSLSSGQAAGSQSPEEIVEKYRNLKRRFDELEEESNAEGHPSTERNVRMREEKDSLLKKIRELERQGNLGTDDSSMQGTASSETTDAQSNSNAGPRTVSSKQARKVEEEVTEERQTEDGRGASNGRASHSSATAPRTVQSADRQAPPQTTDVEMGNAPELGSSSVGASRRDPKTAERNKVTQASSRRTTKQARGTKGDGAAAAATKTLTPSTSTSTNHVPNGQDAHTTDRPNSSASNGIISAHASSSTLAHALGHLSTALTATSSASSNGEVSTSEEPISSTATTPAASLQTHLMQHEPSMESILKVAEAAVAAQNAANQAKLSAMSASQSNPTVDPNLDPNLFSASNTSNATSTTSKKGKAPATSNKPPPVNTNTTPANTNANAVASSSSPASTSTVTPSSSLSNNPYLSLSTNLLPRASSSSATPTSGHPMLMPYPLFYPSGTPVTPNSPSYPIPYNPYYYLAAPMPGVNGLYPVPVFQPPPQTQQRPPPSTEQRPAAKPKRLKAHTITTKSFSIPMVPRDKKGKPMLPLNVGIMTVINLGAVCMREHFHTERYIFPVGYEVTRRYLSTVDPTIEVVYHCTILDGGDGPKFQIIPSDRSDRPIIAGTATGAWSNIVKQANAIRNRQHSNSVSGPDFFGLGQNTIKHLIQELPNADRLRDYVWQNFVEGGPLGGRHAAVIPALPEEYDASMPLGAYYPKRDTNTNPNVPRGMSHYPQHIIAQAEAQKLAAQQQQQQAIAGPSGSNSGPPQPNGQNVQQGPAQIMLTLSGSEGLTIQEYQPPQAAQNKAQSNSQALEKRTTRNSAANSTPAQSAPARAGRATARGNQQQQQQQQQQQVPTPVNGTGAPLLNADGTMPTTFAGIMNAYPAPGVEAPMTSQPTTSS